MPGQGNPGAIFDGGMDRNVLAEARREALSEDRKRSSSHHGSERVDRQIEATVNDVEPSSNARSRKASHVLGLFRENAAPQDGQKGGRKSRSMSSESMDVGSDERARKLEDLTKTKGDANAAKNDEPSRANGGGPNPEPSQLSGREETSQPEITNVLKCFQQPPTSSSNTVLGSSTNKDRFSSHVDPRGRNHSAIEGSGDITASTAEVPAKLLEEIRNYHNLAPPFHSKFRSTQTKSVGPTPDGGEVEQPTEPGVVVSSQQGPQRLDHQDKSSASPTDEEEESDKEQISSALYYPHQVPSPEALQDVSIDDARKARVIEILEPQLPEPALMTSDVSEEPPCDVDITLQSHNKSKHLHGDLPKSRPTFGTEADYSQFIEGGTSSASESEYESTEENIHPSNHEDSSLTDDPNATPRASPKTRKSYLQSRFRKSHRKPKAPVNAVELKPYNHQVGGHSRVFRFSKRAVCKELSNRENVFYEAIEHQHPELLKFLPRYIISTPVSRASPMTGVL